MTGRNKIKFFFVFKKVYVVYLLILKKMKLLLTKIY
jgi:hypothetical protein